MCRDREQTMIGDVEYKLELFWNTSRIPVRYFDDTGAQIHALIHPNQKEPACLAVESEKAIAKDGEEDVIFWTTAMHAHYYIVRLPEGHWIVVGPVMNDRMDHLSLTRLIHANGLPLSESLDIINFHNRTRKMNTLRFKKTASMMYYLLYNKRKNFIEEIGIKRISIHQGEEPLYDRSDTHHSYINDLKLAEAIKAGDREKVFKILNSPDDGPPGILCKGDPLRSFKNLFISATADAARAVIESGVDSETAYSLGDKYIQTLEELDSNEQVTELFADMYNGFIDAVITHKKRQYSRPVLKAIEYIQQHYNETIEVEMLSRRVNLSKGHFSKIFKQETGETVNGYIQKKRIEEVKKYLKHSELSIIDICHINGYKDQSYMTRNFKKQVGVTPKQYRMGVSL